MKPPAEGKAAVDALLEAGQYGRAASALVQLWNEKPGVLLSNFVQSRCMRMPDHFPVRGKKRLAILRSFTVEPLLPVLTTEALLWGLELETWVGQYDAYGAELMGASEGLAQFAPDIVLLWLQPPAESSEDAYFAGLAAGLASFRKHSGAAFLITDFEQPAFPIKGLLDDQARRIESWNRRLRELDEVCVFPYDQLVARHGRLHWSDPGRMTSAGLPVRSPMHIHLVREWLKFLVSLAGLQSKVVVTDLDNVIWKGVLGEDGPEGIRPNLSLQRKLRTLRDQGFLLAVCSKNDASLAEPVLAGQGPKMELRLEDFAAVQINWNDKGANLLAIARELNVGQDALLFLDDSPFERGSVRASAPGVAVLELPDSADLYALALEDVPTLHRLALSAEDGRRAELYQEEKQRASLRSQEMTFDQYLRSLELKLESLPVDASNLARAVQLTQKTNQFNLTTRRYTTAELSAVLEDSQGLVRLYQARDCFGDYGTIGLIVGLRSGEEVSIDTFLVSCRALNRGLEFAMLALFIQESGCSAVLAEFKPTAKNALCAGFLKEAGLLEDLSRADLWRIDSGEALPQVPDWISAVGFRK